MHLRSSLILAACATLALSMTACGSLHRVGSGNTASNVANGPAVITPAVDTAKSGANKRFATDGSSSYAIDSAGHLWAWGNNQVGELGDGSTMDHSTPVRVQFPADLGNASIMSVAVNGHHSAYAIDSVGHLWAWGDNARAQLGLGHGDLANRLTPTQVRFPTALGSASIVSVATAHDDPGPVFAIDSDGHLWSWGDYNDAGQLGNGSRKGRSTPARIQFPMTLGNASIIRVEVDAWSVMTRFE